MPVVKRSDYKVPDFLTKHVELTLDLTKVPVESSAKSFFEPNPDVKPPTAKLRLNCHASMELTAITLNGEALAAGQYELKDGFLIIKNVPKGSPFTVETTCRLGLNTDLFGYYVTGDTGLVKAETMGMERVYPCQDRPDVLTTYTTIIRADKRKFPFLLSNGIPKTRTVLTDVVHEVTWMDAIPKPTYLFAMVAGKLERTDLVHTTKSGQEVGIHFYLPKEVSKKADFAKKALVAAMKWDEARFGLECPLTRYMVAGVDKYASGASEPLGLNLFNTTNLLGSPSNCTDGNMIRILEVVAHEYFHTWTGNLVTIRDWFNLAAKEGLTTLRASLFLEDVLGFDPERLFNGMGLESRAPRPDSYTEVRSLYTAAAYEKSAEIFRMMMQEVGADVFNQGMADFLKKNKGSAITLEDLVHGLSYFCKKDLSAFLSWFDEPGTPSIEVREGYNEFTKAYSLEFITTGNQNRPLPVRIALFDKNGKMIVKPVTYRLKGPKEKIVLKNIPDDAIPSLLRGFSAPVSISYPYDNHALLVLMSHDDDIYNRCKAARMLSKNMVSGYCASPSLKLDHELIKTYRNILRDPKLNKWVLAELLVIPSEESLITSLPQIDFEKLAVGRRLFQRDLALQLKDDLIKLLEELNTATKPVSADALFDMDAAGKRRLKSVCYSYLLQIEPEATVKKLVEQFETSLGYNMTDTISSLRLLAEASYPYLDKLLTSFYEHWKKDTEAINYWLSLQAAVYSPSIIEKVAQLMSHPAFDFANPNKVMALLGSFIKNPYGFHAQSGKGYDLIVKAIVAIEKINPTLAANLAGNFNNWAQYDKTRQDAMIERLRYLVEKATTDDVKNMAKKGLEKAPKAEAPKKVSASISHTLMGGAVPKTRDQKIMDEVLEEIAELNSRI